MTREEAINNIKELQDTYIKCRGEEDTIEVLIDSVDIEALDIAKKVLEQEPRWIPVSERLPEENGGYLVTLKRGYVTTALWVGNAENWKEVTAWMPLPKPYEPQESEET